MILNMKIAVMQPYIFPYIGYFQLINAVDKFVFYDDVNFIKHGWINRNRILVNGKDLLFTVPIQNISQNRKINETEIAEMQYNKWYKKFKKTLNNTYLKAPYYEEVIEIIENVFETRTKFIPDLTIKSVLIVCEYLGIKKQFESSSEIYSENVELEKADRLIDICKRNKSTEYINPIGGKEIYTKAEFAEKGINLKFLSTNQIDYKQFVNEFIPNLSIIDVMMFNPKDEIKRFLNEYKLL